MRKRYGTPYKGSKNQIAKQIIDFLPTAETLVDICAGGCAITHCALESGKYSRVIANDIDPMPIQLFVDAVNGKYTLATEKRWIDRETFFALKGRDPYVRYCWSFGNNGKNYLYGKTIEPWKKAYHYARVCDDWSLLEAITGPLPPEAHDNLRLYIRRHNDELKRLYATWYQAQYGGRW